MRKHDSSSNPYKITSGETSSILRFVAERASELGVLLVHYSKPRSAQSNPTNGSITSFEQIEEMMFCWHPTKEELNQWVQSKEREFAEKENKSPRLSTEDWLQNISSQTCMRYFLRPMQMSCTTGCQVD